MQKNVRRYSVEEAGWERVPIKKDKDWYLRIKVKRQYFATSESLGEEICVKRRRSWLELCGNKRVEEEAIITVNSRFCMNNRLRKRVEIIEAY